MAAGAAEPKTRDIVEIGEQDMRPGIPHARPVEDIASFESAPVEAPHQYRARWQLFVPTIAIAAFYSAAWIFLFSTGRGDGSLARLFLIVMAVGVPLLAAHAFLRYQTIRVQVLANAVRYHPGWPKELPVDMPLDLVETVRVRKGIAGRVFGGGTLVLELATGEKAAIADLAEPEAAMREIVEQMSS